MKARLHSSRMMVATFAVAIFAGMLIIWAIGLAGDAQFRCSVLDTLFTATSAVCITGLIVLDTGGEFSLPQQAAILVLIQLGGLGIMTFSNFILLARFGKLGIQGRAAIEETHGKLSAMSPVRLIKFIVAYTFILETVGAIVLALRFAGDCAMSRAIWLGVFHAVSAFCNAGFSLFSTSFERYHADPVINLTVMALIVSGGAGYIVAADIGRWAVAFRNKPGRTLSLHSRVVIVTTVALIIAGALAVFFLETSGADGSTGWNERCLHSVFLSVTSRTAGFNTVDTHGLLSATLLVVLLLMMDRRLAGLDRQRNQDNHFCHAVRARLVARAKQTENGDFQAESARGSRLQSRGDVRGVPVRRFCRRYTAANHRMPRRSIL